MGASRALKKEDALRKATIAGLQAEIEQLRVYESFFYSLRCGELNRRASKHGITLEAFGLERASGGVIVVNGSLHMFEEYRSGLQHRSAAAGLAVEWWWVLDILNRWAADVSAHFKAKEGK
jgi:hypothetical protein